VNVAPAGYDTFGDQYECHDWDALPDGSVTMTEVTLESEMGDCTHGGEGEGAIVIPTPLCSPLLPLTRKKSGPSV